MAAAPLQCVEVKAASPRAAQHQKLLELHVRTLAGQTAVLSMPMSSGVEDLLAAAEALLGMPAHAQRWLRGEEVLALDKATKLVDAPLHSGDAITVVRYSSLALPDQFELTLTSVRHRRIRTGASSAFGLCYVVRGNIPDQKLEVQPWRKNDHDVILYDGKAKTQTTTTSHWMCGSSEHVSTLHGDCPLTEFVTAWSQRSASPAEQSDLFWRPAGYKVEDCKELSLSHSLGGEDQSSPNYRAVHGWFIAPFENCVELKVDIPLSANTRPGNQMRIIRMLVDHDGKPLRVALKGCAMGCLHEDIEEYDVDLTATSEWE